MTIALRYGMDESIEVDVAAAAPLLACTAPRGTAIADPRAALRLALGEPLEYPPLARGTTPGDRVVVALGDGVPQAESLVTATIEYLIEAGVSPEAVTILQAKASAVMPQPRADRQRLPKAWRKSVVMTEHDPDDRRQLAYLARGADGQAVLLNRALIDADVVLPLGCLHGSRMAGYYGLSSALYPRFSQRQSILRFRAPDVIHRHGKRATKLAGAVDEVGWLLGVSFTIQVLPGGGDRLLGVLAGEPGAVAARGDAMYRQAWGCNLPGRVKLAVAAIEGGDLEQTWESLGQALAVAAPLVEPGGAIAVCSRLAAEPGPAVRGLAEAESFEEVVRQLREAREPDTLPAIQLAQTLRHKKVYLLSRLDASLVEQLNMVPLADAGELLRLIGREDSWAVLGNAPHLVVSVGKT